MAADDLRRILAINLMLQAVYLPTGLILATRSKSLVKGFGWVHPSHAVARSDDGSCPRVAGAFRPRISR